MLKLNRRTHFCNFSATRLHFHDYQNVKNVIFAFSNLNIMGKAEEIKMLVFEYLDVLADRKFADLKDVYVKFIPLAETENYKNIVREAVFEYRKTYSYKRFAWRGASILQVPDVDSLAEFLSNSVIVNTKKKK